MQCIDGATHNHQVCMGWGRKTGMAAEVLHLTNEGQSVPKHVKEGMKGRLFGLACNPPPHL